MQAFLSKTLGLFGSAIQYYCIAHCTFEYVGDFVICSGPSMEPTIHSENILVTERYTPKFGSLNHGDIVIAKCPVNPSQQICKRVRGLPGDRIILPYSGNVQFVPRGHIWLEGDNVGNSADSRVYGPVPLGLVRSRAVGRIWPLDQVCLFN